MIVFVHTVKLTSTLQLFDLLTLQLLNFSSSRMGHKTENIDIFAG